MLGPRLIAHLSKRYAPDTRLDQSFGRQEMTFITNADGDPMKLFIGDRNPDGAIRGEWYVRTLLREAESGRIIKDHWDRKGNTHGR